MIQKVLNILKVVAFSLLVADLEAQQAQNLTPYIQKSKTINRNGMLVLTSWSSANILSGLGYFVSNHPEEKYFYAMNAGWGLVNLSIALPSLYEKGKKSENKTELIENQKKIERLFVINAGLDVLYMGGGLMLADYASKSSNPDKAAMFSGFGKSIVLQGAGLFVFDLSMFLVNKNYRKKNLMPLLKNSEISLSTNSFQYRYSF